MSTCSHLASASAAWSGGPGAVLLAAACAGVCVSVLLLAWLSRVDERAKRGDESAASAMLLPVYWRVFAFFCAAQAARAAVVARWPPVSPDDSAVWPVAPRPWGAAAATAAAAGLFHTVSEGVAIFLVQRGAGLASTSRSVALAAAWGVAAAGAALAAGAPGTPGGRSFAVLVAWHGALLAAYAALRLLPAPALFRRPAVLLYAAVMAAEHAAGLAAALLTHYGRDEGLCAALGSWCVIGVVQPPVLYLALRNDSAYWMGNFASGPPRRSQQHHGGGDGYGATRPSGDGERRPPALDPSAVVGGGLSSTVPGAAAASAAASMAAWGVSVARGRRAPSPMVSPVGSSPHSASDDSGGGGAGNMYRGRGVSYNVMSPLLGQQLDAGSAREVASGMDDLGRGVRVINFAFLSLGRRLRVLGAGGTSRVYEGKLRGEPVAVKMIYVIDLTPRVVANFFEEARVMASLRHPNVVRLLGVCVAPPSLCLVMELVKGGTLFDFLHGPPQQPPQQQQQQRQRARPAQLGWRTRFALACSCARAVVHLHERHVTHMDIKSLNFLLDEGGANVKLCDFEWSVAAGAAEDAARGAGLMDADTLNWMPPEAIAAGGAAVAASGDVYGLGTVLYEIFTGVIPFREYRGRRQLRNAILAGARPQLPANMPPALASLLLDSWRADPAARPSAAEVLARLNEARSSMALLMT